FKSCPACDVKPGAFAICVASATICADVKPAKGSSLQRWRTRCFPFGFFDLDRQRGDLFPEALFGLDDVVALRLLLIGELELALLARRLPRVLMLRVDTSEIAHKVLQLILEKRELLAHRFERVARDQTI